jgi:large subunit ribosomal protein L22
MAQAVASLKHIRISPRKARLVADAVRGKNAEEARAILKILPKKGARLIYSLLQSALANAEQRKDLDISSLYVKEITVNGGPTLMRWKSRAMGRATKIRRRTSHIQIVLAEK